VLWFPLPLAAKLDLRQRPPCLRLGLALLLLILSLLNLDYDLLLLLALLVLIFVFIVIWVTAPPPAAPAASTIMRMERAHMLMGLMRQQHQTGLGCMQEGWGRADGLDVTSRQTMT
jgi:hypothetical protein